MNTPETDTNCWREGVNEWVAANFARELERERNWFRAMAETLFERNAKQAVNINKLRETLKEIASLNTSQDASPQQCEAVLIAMNALKK
jgi:hypothetical protein